MKQTLKITVALTVSAVLATTQTHAAPGDLDSLDLNIVGFPSPATSGVFATAIQRDGKIIIGGDFASVLGVTRNHVARLNADGTLDTSFNLNLPVGAKVNTVVLQRDGKILLGGGNIRGTSSIGRFNVDGMLDAGFDPKPNASLHGIALQPDGKVLLGGSFTTLQPNGAATATTRNFVARVNADGTLDTTFDPNADNDVYSVAVETDGKVLLGGFFESLKPNGAATATTRNHIARVNSDGTLDTTFDPNPNDWVNCLAVQADGRVVFGGDFTSIQPAGAPTATTRRRLARVNANGTLDSAFDPSPNGRPMSIALLADGTTLLGGYFTHLQPNGAPFAQPRSYIARINPGGTLDTAFDPNPNKGVRSITVQADGRVLIGGEFASLQPNSAPTSTARNFFARLLGYPTEQTLSLIELPHLRYELLWHRLGATPELTRATFELSQDGGATFSAPIVASRVGTSADWSILLFSVNGSGLWRARGYTGNGQYNGSSSIIEQVLQFGPDTRVAIPLFNTGVDSAGTPLGVYDPDSHYTLLPPSPVTGAPLAATAAGGFPIPPWLDDNTTSAWINPTTIYASAPGDYVYQTTFDLTGLNYTTANIVGKWAVDDAGVDILVNGVSTGQSNGNGFTSWTSFQISSGFVPGVNTLTFKVTNGGGGPNPTGLRVEMTGLVALDLRIISITKAGSDVTLTWLSQPGRTYRVQSKASLLDPTWSAVPGDVVATSGISSKTFSVGNPTAGFYRVLLLP